MSERLVTRQAAWFLLFSFFANSTLSLLFAVLPLFASETSGSEVSAGLTTGAMMLATVLVELASPRLMASIGYRRTMELGVVLLGFPALALLLFPNLATVLLVAMARGAGLAITVVAGTAMAVQVFPLQRRAEGLGLYGAVVSVPAVLLLPLGLWLAERFSFDLTFVLAGTIAIAGLAMGHTLPNLHRGDVSTHGIAAELRNPAILRPTVIFGLATFAIGTLVTYLALAVPEDARDIAAIGLFIQAIFSTGVRWVAGRLGDRVGSQMLLAPSMLLCAVGVTCIIATDSTLAVLAGMALFGAGLGAAQNASLAVVFERAGSERVAQASVLWNLAYDAGMGIGAVGFGLVSDVAGYPWGFALVAILLFATIPVAWGDRQPGPPVVLIERAGER